MVGGATFAQAITFAVSPVLTRLYVPGEFGVLAVYGAVLGVLVGVVAMRYDFAIPLPEDDETAAHLLVLALAAVLALALVLTGVILYGGSGLLEGLGLGALSSYWYLIPVGVGGAGVYSALNYWAVRERSFDVIARTRVSRSGTAALVQVGLGAAGAGPLGLLTGHFLGQSAGIGALSRALMRKVHHVRAVTLRGLSSAASRYRRFPLVSAWGTLLNNAGLYVPAIALAAIYGPAVAGWFALAERTTKVPFTLIGNSAAQVYMGEAADTLRNAPYALRPLFRTFALRLLLVGIVPATVVALVGPDLFRLVFGAEWEVAGVFARVLAIAFVVRFVASPLSQTLNLLERQGIQLVWEGGRLLAVAGVFVLTSLQGWTPEECVLGYSVVMAISYVVIVLVSWSFLPSADPHKKSGGGI
jgi:O-antigen/teichoic acid export membrane protein